MKSEIKLDWNFKWSMLNDLARVFNCPNKEKKNSKIILKLGHALHSSFPNQISW